MRKPRCDKSHTGVFGRNSYQILKFCLVLNSYGFYIIPSLIIWWSRSSFSITVPWMTCRTGFFSALSGPGSSNLKRRFAVHQFDAGIEQLADIVNTSPYFWYTTVNTEQSVNSLHGSSNGIFCSEYGITRSIGELSKECEVDAAIRDDIRAVALCTRHEECGDIRHHGRYADCTVLSQLFDLICRVRPGDTATLR